MLALTRRRVTSGKGRSKRGAAAEYAMMPSLAGCFLAALVVSFAGAGAVAQERLRFVMVTHGAASDPFWAAVKEGAEVAAEEQGVELVYRAPETFDLGAMAGLVEAAVGESPDGLIVSLPNAEALAAPIQAASDADIPVISINSGYDVAASLGSLVHVGQSEYEAGRVAGERMRDLGGAKAVCLNHEPGNVALDLRCKGFIDGFGGSVEVMPIEPDPDRARMAIAERLVADPAIDVILALSASLAGEPAIAAREGLEEPRTIHIGSFDTTRPILQAVAEGKAAFAIDQQPFLQGYLPVQYLALLERHGVVPVSNVSTGPRLVDRADAAHRLEPEEDSAAMPAAATVPPGMLRTAEPDGG